MERLKKETQVLRGGVVGRGFANIRNRSEMYKKPKNISCFFVFSRHCLAFSLFFVGFMAWARVRCTLYHDPHRMRQERRSPDKVCQDTVVDRKTVVVLL